MNAAGAYTLLLSLSIALRGVDAWMMRTVTSYQARVFVSGIPNSLSSGGNLTFNERYRATMDSVTTSSIEGALMYLQRDCIDLGTDPTDESVNCQRKNNVSVITFLEVQIVQPNAALAEYQEQRYMYPEFCPFWRWRTENVPMQTNKTMETRALKVGRVDNIRQRAQAFSADMVAPYYDTVWFSYPNSCVTSSWKNGKSNTCREQYPGGLCPFGTEPDGGNCTFSYKILGYLSIDQLKASTKYYNNYSAFCEAGNVEFHSYDQDKTLGLKNNPSSLEANIARTQQMIALYNALADESTNHMQQLPSDLDAAAFLRTGVLRVSWTTRSLCPANFILHIPELDKASRTVSDSELRSGIFATLATQISATSSSSGSTRSQPLALDLDGNSMSVWRAVDVYN
ncbi:hypothetical protein GQ600_16838 [Phytophthora cactorum]|nr:hypothetical protein GQ600_16838 [Phytophthora cactorum]